MSMFDVHGVGEYDGIKMVRDLAKRVAALEKRLEEVEGRVLVESIEESLKSWPQKWVKGEEEPKKHLSPDYVMEEFFRIFNLVPNCCHSKEDVAMEILKLKLQAEKGSC